MVRERLGEVVAHIPPQAQPVGHDAHELTFRAQSLEEENQLELEEDNRVDRWPPDARIGVPDQITDEGEIERVFEVAIEMPGRHEVIQ
jgi:hypothetical protein